jgi:hypothetical protein
MNWNVCLRNSLWPDLRNYLGIYLEELKKLRKSLVKINCLRAKLLTRNEKE